MLKKYWFLDSFGVDLGEVMGQNHDLTNLDFVGRGWEKLCRRLLHKWMGVRIGGENVYNLLNILEVGVV